MSTPWVEGVPQAQAGKEKKEAGICGETLKFSGKVFCLETTCPPQSVTLV